jgi:hypothetical protein
VAGRYPDGGEQKYSEQQAGAQREETQLVADAQVIHAIDHEHDPGGPSFALAPSLDRTLSRRDEICGYDGAISLIANSRRATVVGDFRDDYWEFGN